MVLVTGLRDYSDPNVLTRVAPAHSLYTVVSRYRRTLDSVICLTFLMEGVRYEEYP